MQSGLNNFDKPWAIEAGASKTSFCPAKATWYPHITTMFNDCIIAYETGVFPKPGGLYQQSEMFADVFRYFVVRWTDRRYHKVWSDVYEFTPKVLEQIAKLISKAFGGK